MDIMLHFLHIPLRSRQRARHCSIITASSLLSPEGSPLSPRLSRVVILDPPLAIRVHEAGTAAVALGAAAAAYTAAAVSAQRAAETEQDRRNEEACERGPGEAHQVAANGGLEAGGAEGVAALDDPGSASCKNGAPKSKPG